VVFGAVHVQPVQVPVLHATAVVQLLPLSAAVVQPPHATNPGGIGSSAQTEETEVSKPTAKASAATLVESVERMLQMVFRIRSISCSWEGMSIKHDQAIILDR
jgi:hypothetical protein